MRSLFVASDAEEMTQLDFWNLYRDTFGQRPAADCGGRD